MLRVGNAPCLMAVLLAVFFVLQTAPCCIASRVATPNSLPFRTSAAAGNACDFPQEQFESPSSTGTVVRLAQNASMARACLQSIPDHVDKDGNSTRWATLAFANNALDFYVFHQQNKDSGAPFNLKVDGQAQLQKIGGGVVPPPPLNQYSFSPT